MKLKPHVVYKPDEPAGGGPATPPPENVAGEARRKAAEAEARARAAETERDEMKARLDALESQGQSELEKAQQKAARLEAERDTLKGTLATNEREKHVRSVAGEYKPHSVEALLKFVDLSTINSEADAKVALDGLKTSQAFLFAGDGAPVPGAPAVPQQFGSPVPAGGVAVQPAVPMNPDGSVDVPGGIGMGLLGALDRFRSGRAAE